MTHSFRVPVVALCIALSSAVLCWGADEHKNMFANSSFEDASLSEFPDCWTAHPGMRSSYSLECYRADTTEAYHGKQSVRLRNYLPGEEPPENGRLNGQDIYSVRATRVNGEPGKIYAFSIYMKSDGPTRRVQLVITSGTDPQFFDVTNEWQRYSVVINPLGEDRASRMQATIRLWEKEGTVWLDAAQLEEGDEATEFEATPAVHTPTGKYNYDFLIENQPQEEWSPTIIDGEPFFPYGMWHVMPDVLDECAGANFNSVFQRLRNDHSEFHPSGPKATDEALIEELDKARDLGLKVTFASRVSLVDDARSLDMESAEKYKRVIDVTKDHPATMGYYILDEPDWHYRKYVEWWAGLTRAREVIKDWAPDKLYWTCYTNKFAAVALEQDGSAPGSKLIPTTDVLTYDPYPISQGPLRAVADYTERAKRASQGKVPVWIVLQNRMFANEMKTRDPMPEEIVAMTYIAIAHGANGIWFFTYLPNYPPNWDALRRLGKEIRELTPALLAPPDPVQPVPGEPRDALHMLSKLEEDGQLTLIAVNDSPDPLGATTIKWPEGRIADGAMQVLFEDRSVAVENNAIRDAFGPFERHIYRMESAD